jgi:hypothetical protein
MVERLYNRVQEVKKLWGEIKFKWHILSYRDKYKHEQGERDKVK